MSNKENLKKKVGRPIEKKNRVKIGLSIDGESNELLSKLSKLTGKTKSKIFEEAIRVLEKREETLRNRIATVERLGDAALLDFDEFIKNRKAIKLDEEVEHVASWKNNTESEALILINLLVKGKNNERMWLWV